MSDNEAQQTTIPVSFRVIGVLMLIWNLMGCINYLVQTSPEALAAFPEAERALIEGRPAWATSGFAIAVWGGALGCLLLLLRRQHAFHVLAASLAGVFVSLIYTATVFGDVEYGIGPTIGTIVMPLAGAVFLVWYAMRARQLGWLR